MNFKGFSTVIAIFGAVLLVFSCKSDKKDAVNAFDANIENLSGNWINTSFVSRANSSASVIEAQNKAHMPYAFAFTFLSQYPDSIIVFRGDVAEVRAVKYDVDTVEILNAFDDRSLYFVYASNGDKDITFFDNTSGRTVMDKFVLTERKDDFASGAFARAINSNLFPVDFILKKGKNTQQVSFNAEGLVGGLDGYARFALCLRGDCFKLGPNSDVMLLFKEDGTLDYYAFDLNATRTALDLYQLKPSGDDENQIWEKGKLKYALKQRVGTN